MPLASFSTLPAYVCYTLTVDVISAGVACLFAQTTLARHHQSQSLPGITLQLCVVMPSIMWMKQSIGWFIANNVKLLSLSTSKNTPTEPNQVWRYGMVQCINWQPSKFYLFVCHTYNISIYTYIHMPDDF